MANDLALRLIGGADYSDVNYAFAQPSLDLQFAGTKSLIDQKSGNNLITFSRASSATYVNSTGTIQSAVTNLLLRSEEFNNAIWGTNSASVTANTTVAPNGSSTADTLAIQAVSSGSYSIVFQRPTILSTTLTFSVYLRGAVGGEVVWIMGTPDGSTYVRTQCNLTTSWQRFSVTASVGVTAYYWQIGVDLRDSSQSSRPAQTIYAWGAQLEQSSTVGEYIPTTSTINSAPRFDHNPTTGESLGLLVEEQRTNLLLRSEEFNNWGTNNVSVTANSITAPDGTFTADTVSNLAVGYAGGYHYILQVPSLSTGIYTLSVYAKAKTGSGWIWLLGETSGNTFNYFNVNTGVTGVVPPNTLSTITPMGNGWYRCSATFTKTSANSTEEIGFGLTLANGTPNWDSAGFANTQEVYLWGAQLEVGAFPTSYIPTTTATATRSADVVSISGSNFSSWYQQDEGTVFVDVNSAAVSNAAQIAFDFSEGVGNERIFTGRTSGGLIGTTVVDNGVTQSDISGVSVPALARYRASFAYKQNSLELAVNGGGNVIDESATLPTPDRVSIGVNFSGGQHINGTIRRLTYFPQRLSNANLQRMTQ